MEIVFGIAAALTAIAAVTTPFYIAMTKEYNK